MKTRYSFLILMLLFCSSIQNSHSQVTLSVDSLHIKEVIWLCQDDVWIEDFAYGPRLKMCFSMKNISNDTISVPIDNIHISISYKYKRERWKKNIILDFKTHDSTLVLYPNSTVYFEGNFFTLLPGEITTGTNYRLVNFLPVLDKIIHYSKVVLEIDGIGDAETTFNNCFTAKPFFIDGTSHESIYDW